MFILKDRLKNGLENRPKNKRWFNWKRNFEWKQKGMVDDLFDLLFTVIAVIFVLFFLSASLTGSVNNSQRLTLQEIGKENSKAVLLDFLQEEADPQFFNVPLAEGVTVADVIILAEREPELKHGLANLIYNETSNPSYPLFYSRRLQGLSVKYPGEMPQVIFAQKPGPDLARIALYSRSGEKIMVGVIGHKDWP